MVSFYRWLPIFSTRLSLGCLKNRRRPARGLDALVFFAKPLLQKDRWDYLSTSLP